MLNSIMMSNAPLRPIFIFAISKQILPACLLHNIQFRLSKKGEKSYFFLDKKGIIDTSSIHLHFFLVYWRIWNSVKNKIGFHVVESRQVLCVPIICRSSEKFKNILLE